MTTAEDEQRIWATNERVNALAQLHETVTTVWSAVNPNGTEPVPLAKAINDLAAAVKAISATPPDPGAVAAAIDYAKLAAALAKHFQVD